MYGFFLYKMYTWLYQPNFSVNIAYSNNNDNFYLLLSFVSMGHVGQGRM